VRLAIVLPALIGSLIGRATWAQPRPAPYSPQAQPPAAAQPPSQPPPATQSQPAAQPPPAAQPQQAKPQPAPQAPSRAEPEPAPQPAVEPSPAQPAPEDEPTLHKLRRNFAGSVQLDYMGVPSETTSRKLALDGATAEVSLKLAMEFTRQITANVKMCYACHGVEIGMAYFDLRVADELNFRVGRFTPAFGEFPLRADPANHRTSDKPLPYDMGRMIRIDDWNEGVLPAPWVDNGIELDGTHFFGEHLQADYAAYAIGGPRAGTNPTDFDFKLSRSGESYYIDNNSRPAIGGQLVASAITDNTTVSAGISVMRGTYDPDHHKRFSIAGAHAVLRARDIYFRLEYLTRRTEMSVENAAARFRYGPDASGVFDPFVIKDGGYAELEVPIMSRLTLVAREDGLRRRGNVLKGSVMSSNSRVIRHTAALAYELSPSLRLKLSYEYVDFSDYHDESVIHVGIAGPF
jgi:hypothetical protein